MIDEIRVSYAALRTQPRAEAGGLVVISAEEFPGIAFGLDELGRPHLLLASTKPAPSIDVATLDVATRTLVIGGAAESSFVDVGCLFEAVVEVFEHFVAAVLDAIGRHEEPVAALIEVLEKWQQFLVPGVAPPDADTLASVFGELLVVRDVVTRTERSDVDFWAGPHGGRHDLRAGPVALEVKTTRAHTGRRVTIHGEDQLLAPDAGTLALHFVRLEEVSGAGESVAGLVDELLEAGIPAVPLFEALAASGIAVPELAATAAHTFEIRERISLAVDDTFPRIVPASFAAGARPLGVVDLRYIVDLDHCLDATLSPSAYNGLIAALGEGGQA